MQEHRNLTDWLRRRPLLLIGGALLLLAALGLLAQRQGQVAEFVDDEPPALLAEEALHALPTPEPAGSEPLEPTLPPPSIVVYISGAVQLPGVYRLELDARIDDAVRAAGGPSEDAALDRINLAARLEDEQHVHVPRVGESLPTNEQEPPAGAGGAQAAQHTTINTASLAELDALPRIGPATAQQIIDYRSANGPFERPEDLMQVKGIGPTVYEAVADLITVGP